MTDSTALSDRLPGRRICSSSTKHPAWSCIPRAGIARERSRSCSSRSPPAVRRAGRGSCTGSTATPPACSSSRARTRPTGCCRPRLAERRIEREYIAWSRDARRRASGTIEAPIGRDPRVRTRMTVGGFRPREARTHFTLDRALPDTSLLRLHLDTGRTHQIRVHLQAIGHPVCGDPEYGSPGPARAGAPVPARRAPVLRASLHRRARRGALAAAGGPPRRARTGRRAILSG